MKFCKPKSHHYKGLNNVETSYHYVTDQDVESFHGVDFFNKWKEYIAFKPYIIENAETRYYYSDYKECAYKADCWFV